MRNCIRPLKHNKQINHVAMLPLTHTKLSRFAAETLRPQHLSSSKQSFWGCCTVENTGEPGGRVSRSQHNQWEMPQVTVIASGLPASRVSPSPPALGTPPAWSHSSHSSLNPNGDVCSLPWPQPHHRIHSWQPEPCRHLHWGLSHSGDGEPSPHSVDSKFVIQIPL